MREHESKGKGSVRVLLSVAFAAMFVFAAFAILATDGNEPQRSSEDSTYVGDGDTYLVGSDQEYKNLEGLLAIITLTNGDVIKLTSDITCDVPFVMYGIDITIDMNGFDMYIDAGWDGAIDVRGGRLNVIGGGTIVSSYEGVYSKQGSEVTIAGNVISVDSGLSVTEQSKLTINGNITVTGSYDAVYVSGNSELTVNGDVMIEGAGGFGVHTMGSSTVTINGNVTVSGVGSYGINADGSKVTVIGDVTVDGTNVCGIYLYPGSEVIVSGELSISGDGSKYIIFRVQGGDSMAFGPEDHDETTTMEGYLMYTYGGSTIWTLIIDDTDDGGSDGGSDGSSENDPEKTDANVVLVIAVAALAVMCVGAYFFGVKK